MDSPGQIRTWIDKATYAWYLGEVRLQKGATLDQIADCEKKLDFKFPQDFVELYLQINGFEDLDWNKHMFSLWSLKRIVTEYEGGNFIGFCDFLINSHSIGFCRTDPRIYKNYDQKTPIAETFATAIEMINTSSDLVY